ncbi:hypothetical protein CRG98_009958 [Punica granatum]|uniref:Uncharacterized protein n=1 Tax=Punica granatum TaxID=22663 RepID=A0A2I0KMG4_PUNGR|nr:hypothetical protein CRG98_009958 [Punica granatum]
MQGKSPKVGPKPDAVNAGPKPDARQKPKSWAEARCSKCWAEARCSRCMLDKKVQEMQKQWSMLSNSARRCKAVTLIFSHSLRREGCLLVGDFLQWKKETMKEHELFAIPMQGCREANWPGRRRANTPKNVHRYIEHACMSWCKHVWTCVRRARSLVDARGHAEERASDHAVILFVRKKLVLVNFAWGDRGWSTREGWHDSPVVRGGSPGWTTSSHSTSRHGEVKTAGGLPAKVGTTRLSCGVGGRVGWLLVIARLAMER